MNKAERNYFVDTLIGIAFLVVGISALVFLIPTDWINFSISTTPTVLGLDFGLWQSLHKWAGIAMLVGVAVHQLLHWKWIITMTSKILPRLKWRKQTKQTKQPSPKHPRLKES